ncbi:MAG: hypothetical protein ACJA13_003179 [Paraglaciecola sp.]|jgi:hypothetical protein
MQGVESTPTVETNKPPKAETKPPKAETLKEAAIKPKITVAEKPAPLFETPNIIKNSSVDKVLVIKPKTVIPSQPLQKAKDTSKIIVNDKMKPDILTHTKVKIVTSAPAVQEEPAVQGEPAVQDKPSAQPQSSLKPVTVVEFTLEKLPITIFNTWVLKSNANTCSLHSLDYKIDDGVGMSIVSLVLNTDSWILETQSDIDTSYSGTGLDLDTGEHFNLEQIVKETNVRFIDQYQSLNRALKSAKTLRVTLGFWPTWPVSNTKSTDLKVSYFDIAFKAWENCNQRLSIN